MSVPILTPRSFVMAARVATRSPETVALIPKRTVLLIALVLRVAELTVRWCEVGLESWRERSMDETAKMDRVAKLCGTAWCAKCHDEVPFDVKPGGTHQYRDRPRRIPDWAFCTICGWWLPDALTEEGA